ncbi:peptide transporter permease SapC [Streptomyces sp. CB04723]|uniref:DUF6082 family protein n=1 Tax=Streptomyces TaxID=1883 RepID=UPI0015C4A432|nr:DUF6082 family protein [Streptomyces sp. CB04723]QLG31241.1 peptide transporter permease SapC [Streptomyces sp. CB04723]
MKTSNAVLIAAASVAAVGVAQLVQKDRQRKQTIDAALSRIQIGWLTRASQDEQEAARWAPEGVEPKQYQRMLSGNRMLCQLSLRWRLGLVTHRQLKLYADQLMMNVTCRDYWKQFHSYREAEAQGNKRDEAFNHAIGDAYTRAMKLAA